MAVEKLRSRVTFLPPLWKTHDAKLGKSVDGDRTIDSEEVL